MHQLHDRHRVNILRLLQIANILQGQVEPLLAGFYRLGQLRHDLEVEDTEIQVKGQSAGIVASNCLALSALPALSSFFLLLTTFLLIFSVLSLQVIDALAIGSLTLLLQFLQPTSKKSYSSGSLEISQRYR